MSVLGTNLLATTPHYVCRLARMDLHWPSVFTFPGDCHRPKGKFQFDFAYRPVGK